MRHAIPFALSLALATAMGVGSQSRAAEGTKAEIGLDTVHTSNALDSDLALADVVVLLRGSLEHVFALDDGHLKLGLEARASRHRNFRFEDDRSLGLVFERLVRLSPQLELRGTLTYAATSEGDDFPLVGLPIGIRTETQRFVGALEAGFRLDERWTVLVGASAGTERSGLTRFQDDLLPATKLEPDRNRLRLSAGFRRAVGDRGELGTTISTERLLAETIGDPPLARSYALHTLSARGRTLSAGNITVEASLGAAWMRDTGGLYDAVKPVFALSIATPVDRRLQIRAGLAADFETIDSDDPLASYVRRLETEARLTLAKGVTGGLGFFAELKENLLLENEERSRGAYLELGYALTRKAGIALRLDHARTRKTILDIEERTTAVQLRLVRRL